MLRSISSSISGFYIINCFYLTSTFADQFLLLPITRVRSPQFQISLLVARDSNRLVEPKHETTVKDMGFTFKIELLRAK
jgi:hypothetical protein